ncbi:MAG: hypothetical protein J6Y71_08720 [Ruminococcus sp.]|nr:hypothetical protein [Ruminococcus sp.]
MKKNTLYRLYSGAFIGICLLPAVLMPFVKSDSSKEKRALSELPKLKTDEGDFNINILSDLGDYFSEHFAFRQQLVTADGRIKTALTATSPNTDVIDGTDGWLYYFETIDDYLNINTMNSRQISGICHDLRLVNDYCERNGKQFIFTSVPNKNSLYPEHMPFNYIPADAPDNYELLSEGLSEDSFYVNMKAVLEDTGSSIPLYHATDTHWNNLGAYAGHCALMGALGREVCPAENWTIEENGRLGDLAAMIYPSEGARDTQVHSDYQFTYEYQGHFNALDDVTIDTVSEKGEGTLLMYRDSFGEAILPYMAEQFSSAEFSRITPYRFDESMLSMGETIIVELVERNLPRLAEAAPLMPAPEISDETVLPVSSVFAGEFKAGENEPVIDWSKIPVCIDQNGAYTLITGALPEEFFSGDEASVFITVNEKTYEAFRASEYSDCGNGFSAYIPADLQFDRIEIFTKCPDGHSIRVEVPSDKFIRKEQ